MVMVTVSEPLELEQKNWVSALRSAWVVKQVEVADLGQTGFHEGRRLFNHTADAIPLGGFGRAKARPAGW